MAERLSRKRKLDVSRKRMHQNCAPSIINSKTTKNPLMTLRIDQDDDSVSRTKLPKKRHMSSPQAETQQARPERPKRPRYERKNTKRNICRPRVQRPQKITLKRRVFQETDPSFSDHALHRNARIKWNRRNDVDLGNRRFQDVQLRTIYYQCFGCKNCFQRKCEMRNLPCRHVTFCSSCADQMTRCPRCRSEVRDFCHAHVEDWGT